MTTTTTDAGNGSTDTATGTPERLTGMAQVREAEAYHTASVMHDAIFEADRLCSAIYRAVTDAYLTRVRGDQADPEARTAAETADSAEVSKVNGAPQARSRTGRGPTRRRRRRRTGGRSGPSS